MTADFLVSATMVLSETIFDQREAENSQQMRLVIATSDVLLKAVATIAVSGQIRLRNGFQLRSRVNST